MTKEISDIYNATDDNSKKDSWLIKWWRCSAENYTCKHSSLKISNASSQTEHEHLSSSTDNKRSFRKSQRQLFFTTASVPAAQYQKWVFTGFLKRITISDEMLYNLEFKLPQISQHIHLLIHSEVFESSYKSLRKIIRSCQTSTCY